MKGIHAYWSTPTLSGTFGHHTDKPNDEFSMLPFELVHFICSAQMYKSRVGEIHLYTDQTFYNYLEKHDLLDAWDSVDVEKSKEFSKLNIDPQRNWTSFKTWLVGQLETPFLMMDHDNMIYTPIPEELFEVDMRFGHWETRRGYEHLNKENLDIKGFKFDNSWDWNLDIANTCLLYFANKGFAEKYSKKAIEFLQNNVTTNTKKAETQYLFADQRLLGMMAKAEDIKYGAFSNKAYDMKLEQYIPVTKDPVIDKVGFDHTWFFKHKLKDDTVNGIPPGDTHLIDYLNRHEDIIIDNFPQYYFKLKPFLYAD